MEDSEYVNLPRLYKRQAIDLLMFGFVTGMRSALPMVTLDDSLSYFMQKHNLSEEEYSYSGARSTYYRMEKEFKSTFVSH
jgi:hypothetical protein